jgi:uncharacterized phage protein gp47/JayE
MVPDTLDKRIGSVIYDAIAPCAAEIAQAYVNLDIWKSQSRLTSAVQSALDDLGNEIGVSRQQATKAYRLAVTEDTNGALYSVQIGSRFALPNVEGNVTYVVTEYIDAGNCVLECEQPGASGNYYQGAILPLFSINNLGYAAIVGTLIPGQNEETDDEYRARIFDRIHQRPFGGNIAAYEQLAEEIDGVGRVKVYPVWAGGGTVLLSIIDGEFNAVSLDFCAIVKALVDPEEYTGQGVGYAPIGHRVSVVTPEAYMVNIAAEVTLNGVSAGQMQAVIEAHINAYLETIRKTWKESAHMRIFISKISEAILKSDKVINVTGITINGAADDVEFAQTAALQYIPYLETVTLHE